MKQLLKTGRKALSVFMAVVMAMTALVLASPERLNAYAEGEEVCEHKAFDAWYFTVNPDDPGSYVKEKKCKYCDYTELEKTEEAVNVYYTVTYVNPYVTDTYEDIKNDKLAKTHKTETLKTEYVLSGSAAAYNVIPVREKDLEFGKYNFTGWATDTGSLSNVSTNIVASAQFAGEEVTHKVSFYDADGGIIKVGDLYEQTVAHGGAIAPPTTVVEGTNLGNVTFYKRIFTGWDYDYTKIYKGGGIKPEYDNVPMSYCLVYCDWDGTELAREDFEVYSALSNSPFPTRSNTNEYLYVFSGDWYLEEEYEKLKNKEEASPINLDCVCLSTQYEALPEGSEIKVFAKYNQRLQRYPFNVKVSYLDGYPAAGVTVQIEGADGSYLAGGKTNAEGRVHLEFNYSTSYTVSVTDLMGSAKREQFTIADTTGPYNITLTNASQYHEGGKERCTCTCHSFLGGFHIFVLNVLYSIFKIKYVCCYDMYAVHGSELKYAE